MDTVGHTGDEEGDYSFEERFDHPGKTWASATHRQFSLQAVAVATVNATYDWVKSEAKRVLREVLGEREKERRLEVVPPVACAKSDSAGGRGGGDGEDDGRESTGFSIDDLVVEDADDDDVGAGYTRGGGVAA